MRVVPVACLLGLNVVAAQSDSTVSWVGDEGYWRETGNWDGIPKSAGLVVLDVDGTVTVATTQVTHAQEVRLEGSTELLITGELCIGDCDDIAADPSITPLEVREVEAIVRGLLSEGCLTARAHALDCFQELALNG